MSVTLRTHRELSWLFTLLLLAAVALAACGDDTVDPSIPDAGASKDATTADASGEGGREGGGPDAASDAFADAPHDAAQADDGAADVQEASVSVDDGGAESAAADAGTD